MGGGLEPYVPSHITEPPCFYINSLALLKYRRFQSRENYPVEVFVQIFLRNAVKAVNFCKICGDCGECGENKYFTAFHRISYKIHRKIHRISYKNSPHRLLWQNNVRNAVKAVNAVKKKITTFHRISFQLHRI